MRPGQRTLAWLSLTIIVGIGAFVSGYYLGIGKGAETISMISAQNSVSSSIGELRVALAALERNDLAFSRAQHEQSVRAALVDIGSYAAAGMLPTGDCMPMHRATMDIARLYLIQHPPAADDPAGETMQKATAHCR